MYFVFRPCTSGTYLENSANLEQSAHTHQPTAWPVPHACAQPHHAGSSSHGQLYRPNWGSSAWHSRRSVSGENSCFFFWFQGGHTWQTAMPSRPFNSTDTRPRHWTTQDCTLQANMPQDWWTMTPKVAGVISPATPYKRTQQDEHLQHFRTS